MLSKILFVFVLAALLESCASPVNTQVPVSIFEGPETRGHAEDRKNITFSGGYRADVLAEIIPDVTTDSIKTDQVKLNAGGDLFAGLNASLNNRFEMGAALVTSGLPLRAHAKYMFYGEPSNSAKKGDFSMAVAAEGALTARTHWNASDRPLFSNTTYDADVHEQKESVVAGVLVGYRVADSLLFYSGANFLEAADHGTIFHYINHTKQNDVKIDFKATGYSIPVGYEYFAKGTLSFRVEAVYCALKASQNAKYSSWNLNFGLSF